MELDQDLREILNEFEKFKLLSAKTAEKLRTTERLVSTLENKLKFYQGEISFLKTQIEKKDEHLERYKEISKHFNNVEDKYNSLLKEKESLDAEMGKIKKERECEQKGKNSAKHATQTIYTDNCTVKKVEELKAELHRVKEENKACRNYEQQQHRNNVDYYKQALSKNTEKYEETISKLNEDLAAAQLEIKNLRQTGSFKTMISNQCSNVSLPVVTIQSIGVSSTSEIPPSLFKEVEILKQVQISRVKFPSVKKRKLFNPTEDIEILN